MAEQTENGWQIIDREAGVLVYVYSFAKGATANSFTLRLKDGKLLVISPPCRVASGVFDDLQEFGGVGALLANNGFHHLGLQAWKERFPDARVFADPLAQARIRKKNERAPELEPMSALQDLLGDKVGVTAAPATKCGETWAWAECERGNVWFASDILSNMEELPKKLVMNLLFRLTGSKPGFAIFHTALTFMVKDKKQLLRQMSDEMREHPPSLIIPGHGPFVERENLAEEAQALIAAAL